MKFLWFLVFPLVLYFVLTFCVSEYRHEFLTGQEKHFITMWERFTFSKVPYSEIKRRVAAYEQERLDYLSK